MSHLSPFPGKPTRWPNVDVFFFRRQGQHVWRMTWKVKYTLVLDVKHLFPLTTVPYDGLNLPAPACTHRYIEAAFGSVDSTCVTPTYIHRTHVQKYSFQADRAPCQRLHEFFPFVFQDGGVETLKVGNRILSQHAAQPIPPQCFD
jgi:hypothetical protein